MKTTTETISHEELKERKGMNRLSFTFCTKNVLSIYTYQQVPRTASWSLEENPVSRSTWKPS